MRQKILVVDDESIIREVLCGFLGGSRYDVREAGDASTVLDIYDTRATVSPWYPDLILLDMLLPDMDGMMLLEDIKRRSPDTHIIVITGHGSVDQSVKAMQQGAYDYILKPFNVDEILARVEKALETKALKNTVNVLLDTVKQDWESSYVVGPNSVMNDVYRKVDIVANSESTTVLIYGETGTGKESIARRIHCRSQRSCDPFVAVNAIALTTELMESELFGHEEGAFTGAMKRKKGLFEVASGGTIFLDEIGEMSLSMQAKILRVLQEKKIRRVGGTEEIEVDVRLITATNKDLEKAVKVGEFREDLFYRLNVVPIVLPTLRDRIDDIEALMAFFVDKYNREFSKDVKIIAPEAILAAQSYKWPGNIRELQNVIERTVLLECAGNVLTVDHLKNASNKFMPPSFSQVDDKIHAFYQKLGESIPLEDIERDHIQGVMQRSNGNKNQAAKVLGIDRSTLYNKLRKYSIEDNDTN